MLGNTGGSPVLLIFIFFKYVGIFAHEEKFERSHELARIITKLIFSLKSEFQNQLDSSL